MGGWGGGGEVQKKYSRKGKLNEKTSCTPINPKNYSCHGLKKIHTKNLMTKKNSCCSKIPHPPPPITFLMARPLVTVERKHTGHLNFFNGTNQIYHADEKKKTSHTDKDESKLISTLKSRQFISGGLI